MRCGRASRRAPWARRCLLFLVGSATISLRGNGRGGAMGERWFTDEELREMSRPTMDRAIEALDRGDVDAARALCEAMKYEWRSLHDLMVEGVAGLISYVQERMGEDAVADAWTYGQGRGWRRDVETIAARDRRQ